MNALNDTPDVALAEIAPVLDEAINQLGEKDRAAILLRFFEQRDLSSVGQAMGITQNAVQKRLTRALEKLHILLKHRGVTLSAGALAAALASEAVAAAPAGLATSLSAAALTSMATGGTTLTFLKIMTMTKLKLGVISALVVAGAATPWMIQHQSELKLRAEIRSLQRQLDELGQPRTDYDRSSNLLAQAGTEFSGTKEDMRELLRLRNEVGQLRAQSNDVFRLRAENSQQRSASSARPQINSTEDLAKVPPQDIFPKASWASAGLATPEASLQTFHWATLKGDLATLATLTSTPEDQARFEKAHEGMSDAQRAARMQDITGYRIVGRTNYLDGPTEVAEVAYYYDGRGIFRGLKFERIGDSWKLAPGQR
jgi:predicted DNA-binding protein (UPF0251 family)